MKNTEIKLAGIAVAVCMLFAACQGQAPAAPSSQTQPAANNGDTTPNTVSADTNSSLNIQPGVTAPSDQNASMTINPAVPGASEAQNASMTITPPGTAAGQEPTVGQNMGQSIVPSAGSVEAAKVAEVKAVPPVPSFEVKITKDGFEPRTIDVPIGGKVVFVNMDDAAHQPFAKSPSCNEFDAVKSLAKGEKVELVFAQRAICTYIDNLNPNNTAFNGRVFIR